MPSPMYNYHEPSSRPRHKSHSSSRDHHTREVCAADLLDKCNRLESSLRERDQELYDLRKQRDLWLDEKKRLRRKLVQQEAAQATAVANAVANALATVSRSAPTPPPKPPKYPPLTTSRFHPKDSGSSSTESLSTSSSKLSYRTSTTSMTSIHDLPTYHDEYAAHTQSFEVFMTKVDTWSGARVIQAVEDLNFEIAQFSAALIESFGVKSPSLDPNEFTRAKQNTASRLGMPLTHLLSTTRAHNEDSSALIQPAFQAALCTIIDRTLANFYVGFPAKYDVLLKRLYLYMASSEPQATSSRWRALTHKSISAVFSTLNEQALVDLADDAWRWSKDILTLCGTSVPKDFESTRDYKPFASQLHRIAKAALDIATATKEEVLSTSFEVISVIPGGLFEKTHMKNLLDPPGIEGAEDGNGVRVLCTTGLGLRCFSGDGGDERTLVKPFVILESDVPLLLRGSR